MAWKTPRRHKTGSQIRLSHMARLRHMHTHTHTRFKNAPVAAVTSPSSSTLTLAVSHGPHPSCGPRYLPPKLDPSFRDPP